MKQIRKRLTYANVMSSIAVFLVLGGATAVAAKQLGSKTVGTKQLKANSVTTAKIKKNAVTSTKIKNGAVTGAKVNLSSLGTVPSASHANTADTATNWSRYFTSGVVKAAIGQNVPLFSVGPFSAVGHCENAGGGAARAYTTLTTSQVGSSFSALEASFFNANFNPGTEATIGFPIEKNSPENNDVTIGGYLNQFTAASADGQTLLNGVATSAVFYFGAQCAFWAHGTNNA